MSAPELFKQFRRVVTEAFSTNQTDATFVERQAINLDELERRISKNLPGANCYAETMLIRCERYASFAPALNTLVARINAADPELLTLYNRYAYSFAVSCFSQVKSDHVLPASVRTLYPHELERMRRQYLKFEDSFFSIENNDFVKDMAILNYQLIPLGAEYAEPNGGVSLRALSQMRKSKDMWALFRIILRAGGKRPFYSLHLHTLSIRDFDESGCRQMFLRLGALLEANPSVRGMTSSSWFLDPALATISPHLAHHRELPKLNGAVILYLHDEGATSGALEKSATRRRLFSQGRYVPRVFMRIWTRRDILAWCQDQNPKFATCHLI